MWIRGEIAPKEQFLPFSTIFSVYIFNYRSLITCSFVKFGCAICIFLDFENLICRSTDISKCFRGSLQLRDNESRLYLVFPNDLLYEVEASGSGMCFCNIHLSYSTVANDRLVESFSKISLEGLISIL